MSTSQKHVVLGRVRKAHGLGGVVELESFTQPPDNFSRYEKLRCAPLRGFVRFESLQLYKGKGKDGNVFLARIHGCNKLGDAEALQGEKLFLEGEDLPPLDDGTFYHHALVGKKVCDAQGGLLGEVVAVCNFGAGDLLDVRVACAKLSEPKDKSNDSSDKGNDKKSNDNLFVPFSRDSITPLDDGRLEVGGFYAELLTERAR